MVFGAFFFPLVAAKAGTRVFLSTSKLSGFPLARE
jgi:hypothetical protein